MPPALGPRSRPEQDFQKKYTSQSNSINPAGKCSLATCLEEPFYPLPQFTAHSSFAVSASLATSSNWVVH